MKHIKLYEDFEVETEIEREVTDTTIKDVLADDWFDEFKEDEDTGSYVDSRGIIHIKNWTTY